MGTFAKQQQSASLLLFFCILKDAIDSFAASIMSWCTIESDPGRILNALVNVMLMTWEIVYCFNSCSCAYVLCILMKFGGWIARSTSYMHGVAL